MIPTQHSSDTYKLWSNRIMRDNTYRPSTPAIYLCGGLRTRWQDAVLDEFRHQTDTGRLIIYNPMDWQGLDRPEMYSLDFQAIGASQGMFVRLEKDNPAVGLFTEMGYANSISGPEAWGVVWADHDDPRLKYLDFATFVPHCAEARWYIVHSYSAAVYIAYQETGV